MSLPCKRELDFHVFEDPPKCSKNVSQIMPKWIPNRTPAFHRRPLGRHVGPKWTQIIAHGIPKWTPNRNKWTLGAPKVHSEHPFGENPDTNIEKIHVRAS